jgi:hypothetical protein
MKFQVQLRIIGMKSSKGVLDNGQAYDSTKVYALTDLDGGKGEAIGQFSSEFQMGTSDEIQKFRAIPFPFDAVATCEITTNGKSNKTVIVDLKPVAEATKKAA